MFFAVSKGYGEQYTAYFYEYVQNPRHPTVFKCKVVIWAIATYPRSDSEIINFHVFQVSVFYKFPHRPTDGNLWFQPFWMNTMLSRVPIWVWSQNLYSQTMAHLTITYTYKSAIIFVRYLNKMLPLNSKEFQNKGLKTETGTYPKSEWRPYL